MTEKTTSPVVDLHCHSTASDGALRPRALVQHAAAAGIELLALTDHDTVAGLGEAQAAAAAQGVRFINGVEISVTWERKTLHLVGLNIEPDHPQLQALLAELQQRRRQRAETMALRLQKIGLPQALGRVRALVGEGQITRTHFARLLVDDGLVVDLKQAFKKYLGAGRPANVRCDWVEMERAVAVVHASGGLAVLAHPLRYKLSASWRERMFSAFKQAGGDALEVSAGASQQAPDLAQSTADALRHGLMASVASDFHSPEQRWLKYGRLAPLSPKLQPVWNQFSI